MDNGNVNTGHAEASRVLFALYALDLGASASVVGALASMFYLFPLDGPGSPYTVWGWRIPFIVGAVIAFAGGDASGEFRWQGPGRQDSQQAKAQKPSNQSHEHHGR